MDCVLRTVVTKISCEFNYQSMSDNLSITVVKKVFTNVLEHRQHASTENCLLFSEAFHTFLWHHFFQVQNTILLHIVLLKCPHIQIAFLKFPSCDNQAFIGSIPIAAVAVHLNLKS